LIYLYVLYQFGLILLDGFNVCQKSD